MLSVSARNFASDIGRALPAHQTNFPGSLQTVRAATQHTVLPAEAVLPGTNIGESISHSTVNRSQEDQLAVDKQSSCGDIVDRPFSENVVAVSVCSDSLPPNAVSLPCKADDVEHLTQSHVHEPEETVTRTAVTCEVDTVLPVSAADTSESYDDNLQDVEQSRCTEVVCDLPENVCSNVTRDPGYISVSQPELPATAVHEESSQPVTSAVSDQDSVATVGCVDVVTEPHLPPVIERSLIDSAAEECGTNTTSEEVDGMEEVMAISDEVMDVLDDRNQSDLMEALVVYSIPKELALSAADGTDSKTCIEDSKELLASCHTESQQEISSTGLPSGTEDFEDAYSDADNGPLVGSGSHRLECSESVDSGSLEATDTIHSVMDVCSAQTLMTQSCPNMQSTLASYEVSTTDIHELPADVQVSMPSVTETQLQDKDIDQATDDSTHDDRWHPVDFTIGESAITNSSTFRRCSLDLSGRSLSRIAEESAAGLAAVAGDMEHLAESYEQDMQQYLTSGEYSFTLYLVTVIVDNLA